MFKHNRETRTMKLGLTLIEVLFAVALSAAVAVIGFRHLQTPGVTAKERSCDLRREMLQDHAARYIEVTGGRISRDLREVAVDAYAGNPLPRCPATESDYQFTRGQVVCPSHP